ncbi:hypothetical protein DSO57_1012684 [Entomophthora muscae]|uniref:Uncharacterized protein n=1 Tax=Entomophthora muscae TaxID=34485 RepID=A0ACC2TU18_9FUNG|nr:hypothetical protein DSO57_1012684 [Entomophthora muscae]
MSASALEEILMPDLSSLEGNDLVSLQAPVKLPHDPTHTPWLLARLVLMGLNAYFPQQSPTSFIWSHLQEAIPVLHWGASWWYILPGWEKNLVSLAPLSHKRLQSIQVQLRTCYHPFRQFSVATFAKGPSLLTAPILIGCCCNFSYGERVI